MVTKVVDGQIENNPATGLLDIKLIGPDGDLHSLSLEPFSAAVLAVRVASKVYEVANPEAHYALHMGFGIRDIRVALHEGEIRLEYLLEGGLAFGTHMDRSRLEELYRSLGEHLAKGQALH